MPGMGEAPQTNDPTVVSAFHTALAHQGLLIGILLVLVALAWNVIRTVQFRRSPSPTSDPAEQEALAAEPVARRVLRVGFGIFWIADGLLQIQAAMPLGLPSGVLRPAAGASRGWVQSLMNVGIDIWTRHPVQAAAATVWIQLGIGVLLLVARDGRLSRLAGLGSVSWGLVVWAFGEAFGGVFAPGLTWLFGAPGSVLLYVIAGALIALPQRSWTERDLGRYILVGSGSFFVGMAVLQAWPGRGFWQGRTASGDGTLARMLEQMKSTNQPHVFASWVSAFYNFDLDHGWAVNLFVVGALAGAGILMCLNTTILVRVGVAMAGTLCLADWVLVQDFGVFGGTGTDPNSALPFLLLVVVGYIAFETIPETVTARSAGEIRQQVSRIEIPAIDPSYSRPPWWTRLSGRRLTQALAAVAAIGVVLVGAVPMALASVNPNGDPIVSESVDGTPSTVDAPAPGFQLVDQSNRPVSLAGLRGRVVALTFLDPVCTADCPTIAQEFREADSMLGSQSKDVVFIAVANNPLYKSVPSLVAFDRQEGLASIPNWLFLTGSVPQLEKVWNDYGVQEQVEPAGAMVAHSDLAYVIDRSGAERVILDTDPAPGAAGTTSFSLILESHILQLLGK